MSFDNTCKYLAEQYPQAYVNWLLPNATEVVEVLKTELSIEPIRADAVTFLKTAKQVVHIEFQTLPESNPPIPMRMLDYYIRLKRKYRCEIVQFVIFLVETSDEIAFTEEYVDTGTVHRYGVIRLWEQDPAIFMAHPALLPLAPLTKTNSPQALLSQTAERIAKITSNSERQNLLSLTKILAGLRFELNLIHQCLREDDMKESVVYQEILRTGEQRGISIGEQRGISIGEQRGISIGEQRGISIGEQRGISIGEKIGEQRGISIGEQRGEEKTAIKWITSLLTHQLGQVDSSLREQIQGLSIQQLEALRDAAFDFQTEHDLRLWLDQQEY